MYLVSKYLFWYKIHAALRHAATSPNIYNDVILPSVLTLIDRLCCLVVRVSGYRYRDHGFDPRRYQIFLVVVGLERGPLSLVSLARSIEELLEFKK